MPFAPIRMGSGVKIHKKFSSLSRDFSDFSAELRLISHPTTVRTDPVVLRSSEHLCTANALQGPHTSATVLLAELLLP